MTIPPPTPSLSRRLFLGSTAATAVAVALTGFTATDAAAAPTGASAWTGSTSANDWPILAKATAFRIEGSDQTVRLADGDAATILVHVARRFHYEIDTLRDGDVVGFTPGRPVTQPFESNYLSGTAITIRSVCYPLGARDGFHPPRTDGHPGHSRGTRWGRHLGRRRANAEGIAFPARPGTRPPRDPGRGPADPRLE